MAPDPHEITDLNEIRRLMPHYSEEDAHGMLVERRGTREDAFMLAKGLHLVLGTGKKYILTSVGVEEDVPVSSSSSSDDAIKNIEQMHNATQTSAKTPPDLLEFTADWQKKGEDKGSTAAKLPEDDVIIGWAKELLDF